MEKPCKASPKIRTAPLLAEYEGALESPKKKINLTLFKSCIYSNGIIVCIND